MSSEQLPVHFTDSRTLYAALFNGAGEVFDFDSDNFVALSLPPVDAFYPMSENVGTGGAGFSSYWFTDPLDLSRINGTATPMDVELKVFDRVGGSEDLAADTVIHTSAFAVKNGERVEPGAAGMVCLFEPIYRANDDKMKFTVALELNGVAVTLDGAASCEIVVRQVNPITGADLFSASVSAPDANGVFSLSQSAPNLSGDTSTYRALITVVNDGVTYEFTKFFPGYA